jgi:hypothetical protein
MPQCDDDYDALGVEIIIERDSKRTAVMREMIRVIKKDQ